MCNECSGRRSNDWTFLRAYTLVSKYLDADTLIGDALVAPVWLIPIYQLTDFSLMDMQYKIPPDGHWPPPKRNMQDRSWLLATQRWGRGGSLFFLDRRRCGCHRKWSKGKSHCDTPAYQWI